MSVEFFEAPAFTGHVGEHLDDSWRLTLTRLGRNDRDAGGNRMAPSRKKKRDLFGELMEGVSAMRSHRQGRITLRAHQIDRLTLPPIDEHVIRSTRERLHMSRPAFAYRIGVNPRTLERWEQGRSKPNDQAAALILLVRKYPDMLKRLQQLAEAS